MGEGRGATFAFSPTAGKAQFPKCQDIPSGQEVHLGLVNLEALARPRKQRAPLAVMAHSGLVGETDN